MIRLTSGWSSKYLAASATFFFWISVILYLSIMNDTVIPNIFVLHYLFLHFCDDWCRYRLVTLFIDLAVQFVNLSLVVHLCVAEAAIAVLVLEMIGET